MKTPHFLFAMVGCAVLMHRVAFAAPSSAASAQPSSGSPNTRVSNHQPGSSPSATAASGGSVGNKAANNRMPPVHPPTATPLDASVKNAGKRGLSPVVIGGLANSTKHTVAINGSSMNRKR